MSEEIIIFREKFLAVAVGNVLEYFDFSAFGCFIDVIGDLYFPEGTGLMNFLQGAAVFGAAFFMRPLGGILFGALGDVYSRELALTLSVSLMLISSLALAFLPTYTHWGMISTLCLILIRLCQGVACGGEFVGSMIYTIEGTHELYGYWGGACKGTAVFGNAAGLGVAALIRYALDDDELRRWGWRLPFCIGGVLGLVGMTLRRQLLISLEKHKKSEPQLILEVLNSEHSHGSHERQEFPRASAAIVFDTHLPGPSAPPLTHSSWLSVQTEEDEDNRIDGRTSRGGDVSQAASLKKGNPCFAISSMFLEICVCIGFIAFWCLSYYTIFVWQLYFLTTEELIGDNAMIEKRDAWTIVFASNMAMPFLLPLGGYVGDITGSIHKKVTSNQVNLTTLQQQIQYRTYGSVQIMKVAAVLMFILAVPAYKLIIAGGEDGKGSLHKGLIIGQTMLTIPTALMGGCMPHVMVELFPEPVRYISMGIAYNVANAFVSGTAAIAQTYLVMSSSIPCNIHWLTNFDNYWVSPFQAIFLDGRLHAAGYLQVVSVLAFASLHWGIDACDLKSRRLKFNSDFSERERYQPATEPSGSPVGRITNVYIQA